MKLPSFRSKIAITILIIVLLSGAAAGFFYSLNRSDKSSATNTLQASDLRISAEMTLVPEGDVKQDKKIQGGDTVRFTFKVENNSSGEADFVAINTDVDKNLIFAIKNIQGTTGFDSSKEPLIFRNVTIQPNQTVTISFEATLVYSNQERDLRLQPKLFDVEERFIAQGIPQKYIIDKNEDSDMPSNVKTGGA